MKESGRAAAHRQERTGWRHPVFLIVLTIVLGMLKGSEMSGETGSINRLSVRGADISFTLQGEAIEQRLSLNGEQLPLEVILARSGASHSRLRVWINPSEGTSDLHSALILAKRINATGMKLVVDLHYSNTWADRKSQHLPAEWSELNHRQLKLQVEKYTRETVAAFAEQGTPADIVQIGNEITHGFMWPAGQIYSPGGERWREFADLVNSCIKGARAGNHAHPPAIMIHTDTGGDVGGSIYFFDRLRELAVPFDIIGLTYYPFWNGSLATLAENLQVLASRYGKNIIIAETAYPWTLESGDGSPTVVNNLSALPDAEIYPPTPEGQERFYRALTQLLRDVPNGLGAGFLIWEPGWLPGVPATEDVGSTHNNLTLFDWSGKALPGLAVFGDGGEPLKPESSAAPEK
jgi:arabinogalactan endo-1,4-beta-galactosidase